MERDFVRRALLRVYFLERVAWDGEVVTGGRRNGKKRKRPVE